MKTLINFSRLPVKIPLFSFICPQNLFRLNQISNPLLKEIKDLILLQFYLIVKS